MVLRSTTDPQGLPNALFYALCGGDVADPAEFFAKSRSKVIYETITGKDLFMWGALIDELGEGGRGQKSRPKFGVICRRENRFPYEGVLRRLLSGSFFFFCHSQSQELQSVSLTGGRELA